MSEVHTPSSGDFRRLKVFEAITEALDQPCSRILSVAFSPTNSLFADIYGLFRTFGALQNLAGGNEVGEVVAHYFDIRHAKQAYNYLTETVQVVYLLEDPIDSVAVFTPEYLSNSNIHLMLTQAGDILSIKSSGQFSLVQYYDLRAVVKAVADLTRAGLNAFQTTATVDLSLSDCSEDHSFDDSFYGNQLHSVEQTRDLDVSIGSERTSHCAYPNSSSYTEDGSSPYLESPVDDSLHRRKPRKKPLDDEDKALFALSIPRILDGSDTRTTIMIKNIPNKYTQKMLLVTIDKHFAGSYDFFYLPIDFKNKCNVGYAFVNFLNPSYIQAFYNEMNNKKWERFKSEKICAITYARIQGRAALIQHFQSSSVMNQEDHKVKPLILPLGSSQ